MDYYPYNNKIQMLFGMIESIVIFTINVPASKLW